MDQLSQEITNQLTQGKSIFQIINENENIPIEELVGAIREVFFYHFKVVEKFDDLTIPLKENRIAYLDYSKINEFLGIRTNVFSDDTPHISQKMLAPIRNQETISKRRETIDNICSLSEAEFEQLDLTLKTIRETTNIYMECLFHNQGDEDGDNYYIYNVFERLNKNYPKISLKIKNLLETSKKGNEKKKNHNYQFQGIENENLPKNAPFSYQGIVEDIETRGSEEEKNELQRLIKNNSNSIDNLLRNAYNPPDLLSMRQLIAGHLLQKLIKTNKLKIESEMLLQILQEINIFGKEEMLQDFYFLTQELTRLDFSNKALELIENGSSMNNNTERDLMTYIGRRLNVYSNQEKLIDYYIEVAKFIKTKKWMKTESTPGKPYYINSSFHPRIDKESQTLNPGQSNQDVTMIPGAHGSGKSHWLETQMLVLGYAQSIGWAPCEGANLPIYEGMYFFKRAMTRSDHGLSAGTSEMADLEKFFSEATQNSIVFLDEPGSTMADEDQFFLLMAILEEAFKKKIKVVIVTNNSRFQKYMSQFENTKYYTFDTKWENGKISTNHQLLENGIFYSYAMEIAKSLGFNEEALKYAEMFSQQQTFEISRADLITKKTVNSKPSIDYSTLINNLYTDKNRPLLTVFNNKNNKIPLQSPFSHNYNHGKSWKSSDLLENILLSENNVSDQVRAERQETVAQCKARPEILRTIINSLDMVLYTQKELNEFMELYNQSKKSFNQSFNIFLSDVSTEINLWKQINDTNNEIRDLEQLNYLSKIESEREENRLLKHRETLIRKLETDMNWQNPENLRHGVFALEVNKILIKDKWSNDNQKLLDKAKLLENIFNTYRENKVVIDNDFEIFIKEFLKGLSIIELPEMKIDEMSFHQLEKIAQLIQKVEPELKASFDMIGSVTKNQAFLLVLNLVKTKEAIREISTKIKEIGTTFSERILMYFENILAHSSIHNILDLGLTKKEEKRHLPFNQELKEITEIKHLLEFIAKISSPEFNEVKIGDRIHLKEVCNTFINRKEYKRNSIHLETPLSQITGPNGSGKSIVLQVILENVLLARNWGVANVSEGSMIPAYSQMFFFDRIEGDIGSGKSSYYKEMGNIKDVMVTLEKASANGEKCLVFFDELGSTTTPEDQSKLQVGIISRIIELGHDVIYSTHNHDTVSFFEKNFPHLAESYHLGFSIQNDEIELNYSPFKKGHAGSHGIMVAKKMMPNLKESLDHVSQKYKPQ